MFSFSRNLLILVASLLFMNHSNFSLIFRGASRGVKMVFVDQIQSVMCPGHIFIEKRMMSLSSGMPGSHDVFCLLFMGSKVSKPRRTPCIDRPRKQIQTYSIIIDSLNFILKELIYEQFNFCLIRNRLFSIADGKYIH